MKHLLQTATALSLLFLTACAVPYQPAGANGGYSHKRLGNDRFLVTFSSPSVGFDEQRLRDYCLLRCAEVTKEYQFSYFSIEGDGHDVTSDPIHVSSASTTKGVSEKKENGKVEYEETTYESSTIHSRYETTITYEIKCYEQAPTQGNFSRIFEAESTIFEIRHKYGILDESSLTTVSWIE
ncbi:hypothetical protein [Pelagicoccus sp. SDUM812003]|uniref:CC0125/CC1285 family lipoprotein n=1 Tax=Pelagicoccus sp. SDUM812003 TaxID=3041267 RepID=UPI00280DDA8A|nr:hypothetical protein [Pelagicoccus sp. SDUM812003]MDQ8202804.1 hypothetical protein [Pelagicoccus sp. SDUM812003]